jgi:hypothetical protein
MKQIFIFIFINLIFILDGYAKPNEELLIVQAVSGDRKSFVMHKGLADGYAKGQHIIFSNENVSLVCRAIEVSRDHSLWMPIDSNSNVPFNKNDIISMNSHAYGNVALDIDAEKQNMADYLKPPEEFNSADLNNSVAFTGSMGAALSQSASSVSSTQNSKKTTADIGIEYQMRKSPHYEITIGARYDYDIYRLTTPVLDIPTERTLGTIGFNYHFLNQDNKLQHYYAGFAVGIGLSKTTNNGEISSGLAYLIPTIHLGYLFPLGESTFFVLEGKIESITSREKFKDSVSQNSNEINSKINIGIRF